MIKFLDVNDPGKTVALGERGEIAIKGPNVMLGYWNNPSANAENLTANGFMRTGDVGYVDNDGFLFIVDRAKDMLLCGRYNVDPRNIERRSTNIPLSRRCASSVSRTNIVDNRRRPI